MTRVLKIEDLKQIDKLSVQVLRIISLHIGDSGAAFVDYNLIAKSLNVERDTVRKSVNRMIKNKILEKKDGKLSIPNAVVLN